MHGQYNTCIHVYMYVHVHVPLIIQHLQFVVRYTLHARLVSTHIHTGPNYMYMYTYPNTIAQHITVLMCITTWQ